MSEKAVLTLDGNPPDAGEVFNFLTVMFGEKWPGGVENKILEFTDLVYTVTRQAGITIYQDTEIELFLEQGRSFAAAFDATCGKWLVIVANGDEFNGTMHALRYISQRMIPGERERATKRNEDGKS